MAENREETIQHEQQRDLEDRLRARGFWPVDEAANPQGLYVLRLGPGDYTTGFRGEDTVWLRQHDMLPIEPTHVMECPD